MKSVVAALLLVLAGCRADAPGTLVDDSVPAAPTGGLVIIDRPWNYNGRGGREIVTPHYQLFLTQTEPAFLGRLPLFLESALNHYQTVATGAASPLPAPRSDADRMVTLVFRRRDDWERWTRQTLGDGAAPFLAIRRGGYAWAGTAALFDIGAADTLAIAAHEGWHQFTQRTFAQSLPAWLEETIATQCEGVRWVGDGAARAAVFDPADNAARRERLADLVTTGRLIGVERLVLEGFEPGRSAHADAADTYAQAWALGLMLRTQPGPRRADALSRCVHDAAAGRLAARLVDVLGRDRAETLVAQQGGRGLAVLEAYFTGTDGLLAFDAAYRVFVANLVSDVPARR